MGHVNIEIKARCQDPDRIRSILRQHSAEFRGIDNQRDTYFRVEQGRLKLRQGNIENSLIYYHRPDQAGPKQADVQLCRLQPDTPLRPVLAASLGILIEVVKRREIYFIDNVKFHIDQVETLGDFVEIEAIDESCSIGVARLGGQCRHYMDLFALDDDQLVECSYSDMLLS